MFLQLPLPHTYIFKWNDFPRIFGRFRMDIDKEDDLPHSYSHRYFTLNFTFAFAFKNSERGEFGIYYFASRNFCDDGIWQALDLRLLSRRFLLELFLEGLSCSNGLYREEGFWARRHLARQKHAFSESSFCLSLSVCLFLSVSFCLSLSVCLFLSLSLSLSLSVCLFLSVSFCLSLSLSLSLSVCLCPFYVCLLLSLSVSVCPSVRPSLCLTICLCLLLLGCTCDLPGT